MNGTDPTGKFECEVNDGVMSCTAVNLADAVLMYAFIAAVQLGIVEMSGDKPDDPPIAGPGVAKPGHNNPPEDPKKDPPGVVFPILPPPTDHGQERRDQARSGDTSREVGDPNRVVREGRKFRDSETGYSVYVDGNRVVVLDSAGRQVTQWGTQTRANTQDRIRSGKWIPQ